MRKTILLYLFRIIAGVVMFGVTVQYTQVPVRAEDSLVESETKNESETKGDIETKSETEDETENENKTENETEDETENEEDGKKPEESEEPDEEETDPEESEEPEEPEEPVISLSVSLTKDKKAASVKWDKVQGADSYTIQKSSKKKSDFKKLAAVEAGKSRSYKDKKIEKGSRYYYRLKVKMEDGNAYYSDPVLLECPLNTVSGVKLIRYSTTSIKVTWNKSKDENAKWYKVYYATKKDGSYKLAGTTKNDWYRVKSLKKDQNYFFRVEACVSKTASGRDSKPSAIVKMKTKSYKRTTIFAGDSLTVGYTAYDRLKKASIGGKTQVVASTGLNTMTFHTKKAFGSMTATEKIVQSKPYRVYLMLGTNDIHYRNKNDLIKDYRKIIKSIQSGTPDTDIVILAVPPVTAAEKKNRSGFAQIPAYNKALKALAKETGCRYFDGTDFLKDSTGWLKASYAVSDGVHWTSDVYLNYAKKLGEYDKTLD